LRKEKSNFWKVHEKFRTKHPCPITFLGHDDLIAAKFTYSMDIDLLNIDEDFLNADEDQRKRTLKYWGNNVEEVLHEKYPFIGTFIPKGIISEEFEKDPKESLNSIIDRTFKRGIYEWRKAARLFDKLKQQTSTKMIANLKTAAKYSAFIAAMIQIEKEDADNVFGINTKNTLVSLAQQLDSEITSGAFTIENTLNTVKVTLSGVHQHLKQVAKTKSRNIYIVQYVLCGINQLTNLQANVYCHLLAYLDFGLD